MNIIYVLITPVGSAAKNVQTRTGREGMISKKVKSLLWGEKTLKTSAAQKSEAAVYCRRRQRKGLLRKNDGKKRH